MSSNLALEFAREYCVDFDAAAAARRIGIISRSARKRGNEYLARDDVISEIKRILGARNTQREDIVGKVVRELETVVFTDRTKIVGWDENGEVQLKASKMLSDPEKTLIDGVEIKDGLINIKYVNKLKSLELLMRHLGMLNNQIENEGKNTIELHIVNDPVVNNP